MKWFQNEAHTLNIPEKRLAKAYPYDEIHTLQNLMDFLEISGFLRSFCGIFR